MREGDVATIGKITVLLIVMVGLACVAYRIADKIADTSRSDALVVAVLVGMVAGVLLDCLARVVQ